MLARTVHAMPRMRAFLSSHGPRDQLVRLNNIVLRDLADGVTVRLNERLSVTPFLVPYRDEYSETVVQDGEVPGRAMADIPHPFIVETMERFRDAPADVRQRIRFIHLNRTRLRSRTATNAVASRRPASASHACWRSCRSSVHDPRP